VGDKKPDYLRAQRKLKGGQRVLTIRVGATAVFDEETDRFREDGGFELHLEHSLVALSKWESEFEKPFLGEQEKTADEALAYIRCMVLAPFPPGEFLDKLSKENLDEVNAYINKKMTATWFSDATPQTRRNSETVTAELIYYWMSIFQIEWEAQYWHLNRLFTLIRICNVKQDKPKKMSRAEAANRQRELNARRKAELGTKG
jgi:hypothetical protein